VKNWNLIWILTLTESNSEVILDALRILIRRLFRHLPYDILYIIWEEEDAESKRRGEVVSAED